MSTSKKIFLSLLLIVALVFFISSFIKIFLFIQNPEQRTILPGLELFVLTFSGLAINNLIKKLKGEKGKKE